jgi:hypothetical protein
MDIAKEKINCIFHCFDSTAFRPFFGDFFVLGSKKFNNNFGGFSLFSLWDLKQ